MCGGRSLVGPANARLAFEVFACIRWLGCNIETIPHTGMLSIHDTADIRLTEVNLGRNYEDDTLHLVYVDNAVIRNLTVEAAFSDAVDIDTSTVLFDGQYCRFAE